MSRPSRANPARCQRNVPAHAPSSPVRPFVTAVALALAAFAQPALAVSCTWNTAAGNWAALANWTACVTGNGNPAGTPGSFDTATIGGAGDVAINTGQSVLNLNNAGQINIDAFGLNLAGGGSTTNTGTINVGGGSTANLGVSAGHNINNTGGVINVDAGSVLNQFGSTITGGTINTTGTGALVVFGSGANFLSGVTLGGRMDMASGFGLQRITNGLTLNNGTIDIANQSALSFEGTSTLAGTGSIVFGAAGGGNNRIALDGNGTTTFAAGTTVRGHTGTIGNALNIGGTQTLINNGTISADVSGGTINITGSAVTNNGTLSALNGGTLLLNSNVTAGALGQIVAGAGSTVLQNGVTLSGTVNTSGSGSFRASGSGVNFLDGVTLNGNLDMASAFSLQRVKTGGLVLNGTIDIANQSALSFEGDGGLTGNATVVLGSLGGATNRIALDGIGTTTFAAGTTVRGHTGTIGNALNIGGTQTLINNGTISADVAGGTFNITGSVVTNNGTLSALNGGTLLLSSNVTGGALGQIVAGGGSTVVQNGVTISGTVNTSGSGSFRASGSGSNFLDGVTLNGNLDMASAFSLQRVKAGGLVLNGTIDIANQSALSFEGDGGLTGNATVVLGSLGGATNRIALDGIGTTTFAVGTTVRGHSGTIGNSLNIGGTQTLVNNGTISADVAGGTINITQSSVTNNGTLSALNGGTLLLSSNVNGGAGGQIVAGAGSTVVQNGVTITGIVNTSGSGLFRATASGVNFLNAATLNGNLDMATAFALERVTAGGLVLNGTINIANQSALSFEGTGGLTGNATLVMGSVGGATNRIALDGNGTTTFAAGTTVRGHSGTIGNALNIGGTQTLVNNGTISADELGGTFNITGSVVTNNGTLSALNGGTLLLSSNVTGGVGGQIVAGAGSTVVQNGVTITGIVNTSGSGLFRATASGVNFLNAATLNGNLDMATAFALERVTAGGLVLNGTINIANQSALSFEGTGGLSGNATLVLGSAGGATNRIALDGNGTTTFAAGTTVRGHSGTIGNALNIGGTQTLVNNGTINAELAGGTIALAGSALVNNGLVRAEAGTLNVGVALSGTGTLQVDTTGTMSLANGAKAQGQLVMGATGAALNLNTGNLTISSDYTNVAAGSGDAFNRRAGVTGTGQIVAGGNAAQIITGSTVAGGNTNNATLTIGNVRVGANNINYDIGNSGNTGPTLRGAIQTNVNGANISDGRLSGGGVTAGNYNAGAPAGSPSSQSVTFTAASAGALAPLTGQVLNLRSNFENIADQKLNIVLGSGAAAYNAAVGSTAAQVQVANQRVGGTNNATLNISNTAAAGSFSEDLNASIASFSGQATASGSVTGRLAGSNNTGSGAITVAVNTTTAGDKTGTVNLNYQTAGTVNGSGNGLGTAAAGSQAVTVTGNVYQLAAGAIQTGALNFGTVQVGQTVQQALVIGNTASGAAGFVEDLNASFGAASGTGAGLISGSGSLNGILAGTNSTASGTGVMTVAVNTGAAGVVNGSILVNYTSAGAVGGVSNGLGTFGVGSEGYGVQGTIQANVINQASPVINNSLINLGNVRVNTPSPSAFVSVTNQATLDPQAALNASISGNGLITGSGSFNLLNPGATNNSSLQVGLDTTTAGARNGTATISFVSDATNVGNCTPNCQFGIASQNVNVTGAVYRLANAQNVTPSVTLAARVNDAAPSGTVSITNLSPDAFTEALKVQAGAAPSGFAVGTNPANIAAQGTGTLQVSLNTATAGSSTGNLTLNHISTGAGTTNAADIGAGSSIVALAGKVYTAAAGAVQSAVNFGIVHVNDVVAAQGVSVQNIAPATALNDTLRAAIGNATGPFTSSGGSISGLTAGGPANTSLTVGLNTNAAGVFTGLSAGSATVGLTSQNPDMADLGLSAQTVTLTGQVNKYANAVFDKVSGAGTLSRSGNTFTLDFGNILQGSGALSAILDIDNAVGGGPADFLDGILDVTDGDDFATSLLLAAFNDIGADLSSGNALSFLFDTNTLGVGSFQDAVDLSWFGHNQSGYRDASDTHYTLLVRGSVSANGGGTVPEPPAALLALTALAGLLMLRRRQRIHAAW